MLLLWVSVCRKKCRSEKDYFGKFVNVNVHLELAEGL